MNIQSLYQIGETTLSLNGAAGSLEAILQCSATPRMDYIAILGHPHSLYGGQMQNKVVTTLARVFQDFNIPSLRMNFRGVGKSQGVYDAGLGESDDLLKIIKDIHDASPSLKFILAGFSFGSFVTYRTAALAVPPVDVLLSIAPAVQHYDFTAYKISDSCFWAIVQGEEDDTALPEAVYEWHETLSPKPILIKMPETGHFFHSRLGELKNHLLKTLQPLLSVVQTEFEVFEKCRDSDEGSVKDRKSVFEKTQIEFGQRNLLGDENE